MLGKEGTNIVTSSSLSPCNFDYNIPLDPIPTNIYQAVNSVQANTILVPGSTVNFSQYIIGQLAFHIPDKIENCSPKI